jgi:hypothetical protein
MIGSGAGSARAEDRTTSDKEAKVEKRMLGGDFNLFELVFERVSEVLLQGGWRGERVAVQRYIYAPVGRVVACRPEFWCA